MLVENYSDSRRDCPGDSRAIFEWAYALSQLLRFRSCAFGCRGRHKLMARAEMVKLTWLALGEDQAARSRRVEQLMAL